MKNEQPKNAGQPKTVSVAAGNYMSTDNGMPSSEEMEQAVVLAILTQSCVRRCLPILLIAWFTGRCWRFTSMRRISIC